MSYFVIYSVLRAFLSTRDEKTLLILCRVFRIYNCNEFYVLDFSVHIRNFSVYWRSNLSCDKTTLPLAEDGSVWKLKLQLVGESWPNVPNKSIYIGMTCKYSVKGIVGIRNEITNFTGRCSFKIADFDKCSPTVPLGWHTKLATLFYYI